ncbi:MAG: hypothetical protein LLG04_14880 [Parachlamydia sp.]|nr:hypothetical protein [Parachlamydia sp.]
MCHNSQFFTLNPHFFNLRHPYGYEKRLNCMDCIKKLAGAARDSFCSGTQHVSNRVKRACHKATQVNSATCVKIIVIGLLFFSLIAAAGAVSTTPPPRNSPAKQPQEARQNPVIPLPDSYLTMNIPEDGNDMTFAREDIAVELRESGHSHASLVLHTQEAFIQECLAVELTSEVLARKILVSDPSERNFLRDILTEMRYERGVHEFYVDFVLKQPGLTFAIGQIEEGTEARAIFTKNQILVSERLIHASRDKIKYKLFHELWHFYQLYINADYKNPLIFSIAEIKKLILPYYNTSEKQFLKMIEMGKRRLSNPVIQKSQLHLFDNYEPRQFFVNMPLSNFQKLQPNLDAFWAKNTKNALAPITSTSDNETFSFFVKSYSIEGQNAALICHSSENIQDKPNAFLSDLRLTLRTHHQNYQDDVHYNDLGEIDAVLQEFDQKQIYLFFPERRRFHERKFEKMRERVKAMPSQKA